MAEYADLKAVRNALFLGEHNLLSWGEIEERLDGVPSADVVEVVRCRDCEWWGHIGCAIRIVDDTDKPRENDFCSFGNRKDGGKEDI